MPVQLEASSLQEAVSRAVTALRERVGDPFARVAFLVPSRVNAEQVRRALGEAGPFIHVDFLTPDSLVSSLGQLALLQAGQRPEPSGWLGAWLYRALPSLAASEALGAHGSTLTQPGWRSPIQSVLRELQAGRVDAAMLNSVSGDDPVGERLALVGQIMAQVEQARQEQGYFSRTDVENSALARIQENAALPCQEVTAVAVLGDGLVSPGTFEVLQAWLSQRPVIRVDLPPFCHLKPAPWGIRDAAGETDRIVVQPGEGRLGHLKSHLFVDGTVPAASTDGSVCFASTPDDIREMSEVVRTVQAAIQQGVALDRIAIVLPSTSGAEALASALRRAAIPAAWLTGAPMMGEPCARFLMLVLGLASGAATAADVAGWYDLLTQPGLMGMPRSGRGRWRRLLSECPQGLSVSMLLKHLNGMAEAAEDSGEERQLTAVQSLITGINWIYRDLEAFPKSGSLHDHASSWRDFMDRWWRPGPERDRLLQVIDAWGGGDREIALSMSGAAQLLSEELHHAPKRSGSLTQARIRVMPPMGLLGGAFDLVCVTGLTDGSFPRQPRETPLLTDAMVARLQAVGARVLPSEESHEVERRRFGAVVAACQKTLWLSAPRVELLEGTPLLPGELFLSALSCVEGTRVLFRDLPDLLTRKGSRSRPIAATVDDALGAGEYLVARAVWNPEGALGPLSAYPTTRRLLHFFRSVDRLRTGEDAVPNAWTGAVPITLLSPEALQQEALSPEALARLVLDPAGYFWRDVLGVWRARNIRKPRLDMTIHGIKRQVLDLTLQALADPDADPADRFNQLWEAQLKRAAHQLGVSSGAQIHTWRLLGQQAHAKLTLKKRAGRSGAPVGSDGALVTEAVPLRVQSTPAPLSTGTLMLSTSKMPAFKMDNATFFASVSQGYATRSAGEEVQRIQLLDPTGKEREWGLAKGEAEFQARVQQTWRRVQAGWWPFVRHDDPNALTSEQRTAGWLDADVTAKIVDSMGEK